MFSCTRPVCGSVHSCAHCFTGCSVLPFARSTAAPSVARKHGMPPIPDQQMHDQEHQARGVPEDEADPQVTEAPAQPALQPQALQQGLEQYGPGEGSRLRVREADLRQRGLSNEPQPRHASSRRPILWRDCCVATQSFQSCSRPFFSNAHLTHCTTLTQGESCETVARGLSGWSYKPRRPQSYAAGRPMLGGCGPLTRALT